VQRQRLDGMELRHLNYFAIAAAEENFNRAAVRLHVDQSALSRRIGDLERKLGVELFDRVGQRVRLSPAGQIYFEEVVKILDSIKRAGERARRVAKGEDGVLSLGFYETIIRNKVSAKSIIAFRSQRPNVDLNLEPMPPSETIDAVLNENVNAAFVYNRPMNEKALESLHISTYKWVLALPISHPLADKPKIELIDLQNEKFIFARRDLAPLLYETLLAGCQAGGLTPRIVQYTVHESTRLHLVSMAMGVCFVVSSLEAPGDGVVIRPISNFEVPVKLDLVWRRDSKSPTLKHFIDVVAKLKDDEAA
jgi:DNA-binding transcriptional LysR family regulator